MSRRRTVIGSVLSLLIAFTIFSSTRTGYVSALWVERSLTGMSDQQALVGSTFWSWSEMGAGEPVVLLHGFAGDRHHWMRMLRGVDRDYRYLVPDLPGFGESRLTTQTEHTIDAQLQRLIDWLDHLDLRKVHIAGHSMGGRIAFLLASRYPDRVKSLYLVCPSGTEEGRNAPFHEVAKNEGINLVLAANQDQFERLNDMAFSIKPWIPSPLYRQVALDFISRSSAHKVIWDDLKLPAMSLDLLAASLPPVPITMVWGAEDKLLSPKVLDIFKRALPLMNAELLPGVGHMPPLEVPETMRASLRQHLSL